MTEDLETVIKGIIKGIDSVNALVGIPYVIPNPHDYIKDDCMLDLPIIQLDSYSEYRYHTKLLKKCTLDIKYTFIPGKMGQEYLDKKAIKDLQKELLKHPNRMDLKVELLRLQKLYKPTYVGKLKSKKKGKM